MYTTTFYYCPLILKGKYKPNTVLCGYVASDFKKQGMTILVSETYNTHQSVVWKIIQ